MTHVKHHIGFVIGETATEYIMFPANNREALKDAPMVAFAHTTGEVEDALLEVSAGRIMDSGKSREVIAQELKKLCNFPVVQETIKSVLFGGRVRQ